MRTVLVVLMLFFALSPAYAQTSGATLEKCTCRFSDGAPPQREGAVAGNATLCVQRLDRAVRWCEITIACLRGNIGPECGAQRSPRTSLLSLYKLYLEGSRPLDGKSAQEEIALIEQVDKVDGDALQECIGGYLDHVGSRREKKGKIATCFYDGDSRWMQIRIENGPVQITFSFGPRE